MRTEFRGYYKLKEAEIEEIFNSGFISLDTNVLLNSYRFSDSTRNDFFESLEKVSDRLWLPNNVGFEFHRNRTNVINDEINSCLKKIESIKSLLDNFINKNRSPHLSIKNFNSFKLLSKNLIKDLNKSISFYENLVHNDTILDRITNIFEKKIGKGFSSEELQIIYKDGEDRYKNKIPPGYKDINKESNKYGDYINWKELINHSKKVNKSFLFICDDSKEDWICKVRGKKLYPRPELSSELFNYSKKSFHIFSTLNFLEYIQKNNIKTLNKYTINEIIQYPFLINDYKSNDYFNKFEYRNELNSINDNEVTPLYIKYYDSK